jgi:hypothetical protein
MAMPKVGLQSFPDYSVEQFAPIQSRGPVDGYLSHVNDESDLRNQFFALQSAPQATYIPSSKSDLYQVRMPDPSHTEQQPYPKLFDTYQMNVLAPIRNANPAIGFQTFNNHTRIQCRGTYGSPYDPLP